MDKKTWIENKVAKLIEEGKTQDEAIAIANSMWEDEYGDAADKAVQAEVRQAIPALSEAAEKSLFERIWRDIQARLGSKEADADATGFKVVGNHWMATWTNAYKDRDQQFFPEGEIEAYIARVDKGIVPTPELWVWHGGKEFRVGGAKYVAGHGRFGIAGGEFDGTTRGQIARDYYADPKHAKATRISHGFTYPVKDFDGIHFRKFNTFEISLLPKGAEANLYTSLEGVKAMKIDEHKHEYFEQVFGKEGFGRILAALDQKDKDLPELGVDHKDFGGDEDAKAINDAKALANADKALRDLVPDLMEGSAEAVSAALEAVKMAKASETKFAAQYADAMKQIDALRAEMQLAPRSVTQGGGAVLDPESAAGKALLETVQAGLVEIDPLFKVAVRKPV